ncbi:MAG: L,D-transpeptidase, partial [Bdellovibrionota bacterium]
MLAVRQILLAFTVFVSALQANAQAFETDLGDILSPEEIAEELGFEQQQSLRRNMFWNSSALNPRLHVIINKANKGTATDAQTLKAYLDGTLVYKFKVSTGAETRVQTTSGKWSNRRTSAGVFRIYLRSRHHVSKTWTGASMPFAQFFNGGIAMHATTPDHYHELGRRASGGCVRLHPTNAKLMWELVGKIGVEETLVTVYDGTYQQHPYGMAGDKPLITEKDINNA